MDDRAFTINDQFLIDPALGSVVSRPTGAETRLEPRVMHLLSLLSASAGQLVRRETLTREIWKDYGTADEGLTQAISYLRKVLQDESKVLIETVPKKGYVLHAQIKMGFTRVAPQLPVKPNRRRVYFLLAVVVLLVALSAFLLVRRTHKGNSAQTTQMNSDKAVQTDTTRTTVPSSDAKK